MPETNKIAFIIAETLKQYIDDNPELIIINVLAESYYLDCHIKGSINIPYAQLLEKTSSWDKEKDVVLYCSDSTCSKSKQAYTLLQDLGFINLYQYSGGIKEWKQKGFETVGQCKLDYLQP